MYFFTTVPSKNAEYALMMEGATLRPCSKKLVVLTLLIEFSSDLRNRPTMKARSRSRVLCAQCR